MRDNKNFRRVKQRVNIVSVIKSYLGRPEKEGKAGSAWWSCPFHDEDTPSFHAGPKITKDNGSGFYCFGCQESGDVIDFVEKMEGCETYEALKKLGFLPEK